MAYTGDDLLEAISLEQPATYTGDDLLDEISKDPSSQGVIATLHANNFDTERTASPSLRIYLSRGDNLKEKQARLNKRFPGGELKQVDPSLMSGVEEKTLVWRESPQSQWKLVEPPGFDLTDITEAIAPSAESIAGETAMAVMTKGRTIPVTLAKLAFGSILGETAEQAGQYITDTQRQSPMEVAGEVGAEGLYSVVGGAAMSPISALTNAARGSGALRVGEEGLDIMHAGTRLDPELTANLTPGLVSDNPIMQLAEKQAAALLPGLQRRYRWLANKLDTVVSGRVNKEALGEVTDRVVGGLSRLSDDLISSLKVMDLTKTEGGKALQAGLEQYKVAARKTVKTLYDQARKIEEPNFDMVNVLNLAEDLRKGAKGELDPAVARQITALKSIRGPIQLSDGSYLSVTDQVRNVKTELFSLKSVPDGAVPNQSTGQANDMYRAVTEMLNSPTNANPAFTEAWKKANKAAGKMYETLGLEPVILAAKTQNPSDLVKTYAKPGNSSHLLAIRDTVSPVHWKGFTDSFMADLLTDPAQVLNKINKFDQETLDVLMPRVDQVAWKKVGQDLVRISSVSAADIAEQQVTNKGFIGGIIDSANPRRIQTIMRAANQTNDAAMRDSVRSGIIDWAWDGVVAHTKTGLKVNREILASRIDKLKKNGVWRFLSKTDKEVIQDAEIYARGLQRQADAGTSIQAAEVTSGLARFQLSALATVVHKSLYSHFLLSPVGRRFLIGGGKNHSSGEILRLFGGALTQTTMPKDISQLETPEEQ